MILLQCRKVHLPWSCRTSSSCGNDLFVWVTEQKTGWFILESNEGSDAEASEDDQQPTAAYGWGREPRYSAEELASRVVNVEEEDASAAASDMIEEEYAWPPVSRVGNTDWCECGQKCTAMPNRLECLCCQDAAVTVELVRRYDVSCITDLADYDIVILHRGVLTTALRGYFDMRKQPMPVTEEPDNRDLYAMRHTGSTHCMYMESWASTFVVEFQPALSTPSGKDILILQVFLIKVSMRQVKTLHSGQKTNTSHVNFATTSAFSGGFRLEIGRETRFSKAGTSSSPCATATTSHMSLSTSCCYGYLCCG